MFEADSLNQYRSLSRVADTHFNGSEPNLQERASDFLPLLQRLCCTGMTLRFPALPCSLDSHLTNASGSGRPANSDAYSVLIDFYYSRYFNNALYVHQDDPCPHVRSHFLTKLNQGLYRLRLPLEYIAIFAHAVDVPDSAFKQRAKQLLTGNIQRRRDFLDRHASYRNDTKFLYGLLPDFVLPYLIYLLAHDPEWADINDANRLNRIKASLWFVMEPI
ncbi:hypothetical protein AHF37_09033, partial [Paragonimus kellicotti]